MNIKPLKILKTIFTNFRTHYKVFYHELDPVKNVSHDKINNNFQWSNGRVVVQDRSSGLKYHYLVPLLLGIYILLDSLVIFGLNGFVYSNKAMPQLFTHLVHTPEFWQTGDVIMGLGLFMLPMVNGCLFLCPGLEPKYIMLLWIDDKDSKLVKLFAGGKSN